MIRYLSVYVPDSCIYDCIGIQIIDDFVIKRICSECKSYVYMFKLSKNMSPDTVVDLSELDKLLLNKFDYTVRLPDVMGYHVVIYSNRADSLVTTEDLITHNLEIGKDVTDNNVSLYRECKVCHYVPSKIYRFCEGYIVLIRSDIIGRDCRVIAKLLDIGASNFAKNEILTIKYKGAEHNVYVWSRAKYHDKLLDIARSMEAA